MKQLVFLLALGAFFFTSCEKSGDAEITSDKVIERMLIQNFSEISSHLRTTIEASNLNNEVMLQVLEEHPGTKGLKLIGVDVDLVKERLDNISQNLKELSYGNDKDRVLNLFFIQDYSTESLGTPCYDDYEDAQAGAARDNVFCVIQSIGTGRELGCTAEFLATTVENDETYKECMRRLYGDQ